MPTVTTANRSDQEAVLALRRLQRWLLAVFTISSRALALVLCLLTGPAAAARGDPHFSPGGFAPRAPLLAPSPGPRAPLRSPGSLASTRSQPAGDSFTRAQTPSAADPDLRVPADGRTLYESACVGCHGPDGRGLPQATVGFDVPLPDFTDCAFASPEADADWLTIVAHGGPVRAFDRRMPAFGSVLNDEEIARILAYIRTMCADRAWPRGELNLPRPLRTEKAFPENEAVLTTTFDSTAGNRVSNEFLYERRIGSRSQWEVKVPLDARGTGTDGRQAGLGDISLGFKRVLGHSLQRGAIISAGGEIVLPTGKEQRGLGSGTTIVEPFLAYGQILPHDAFIQAHTAVELPADTGRASREAFWRVTGGRTFAADGGAGRAWSPMLELLGARDLEAGAAIRWDVVPQVQVTLSKRQHVMLNAGVQIPANRRAGRGARFITYLLWDWWDGGFFEGW